MPIINCDTCGKPFRIKPSQAGIRRRCSLACIRTQAPVVCEACGKVFMRAAWHRNAGYKRTFCSIRCASRPHTATYVGTRHRHAIRWERLATLDADLAYFVGLMLSDGNVRDNGAVSFVSLDRCSTEFVRDFLSPDSPIKEEATKAGAIAYRWHLWSKPVVAELSRFGIVPRKSLVVRMPTVPEPFVWDFVRGLLDGDGTVDAAGRAAFSTGSPDFAADLGAFFAAHDLRALVYPKKRSHCVMLNVPSSRQLAALMYRDDCPHLARKRARFH